jgi:hypothetical protein
MCTNAREEHKSEKIGFCCLEIQFKGYVMENLYDRISNKHTTIHKVIFVLP